MTYEQNAKAIARYIWEKSTNNGRDLPEELWDDHMKNCEDAVANAYQDGISLKDWEEAALRRITS